MNLKLQIDYSKKNIYIVFIIALIKLFFAAFLELGNDESYYYTYAISPQLNYFDHPPMVGLLMRLTTLNLQFVNDITLRLGAIFSCALASLIIFNIGKTFFTEEAGFYASLVYQCSIYTGIIAGFFILPDSLQLPFWCFSIFLQLKIIENKNDSLLQWLLLGFVIGIATLCKIHSLYLWVGFGLYIMIFNSKLLLNYKIYLSIFTTLICCLPILIWNIENNFITYTFHSKRVTHTTLNVDAFIQELVGEILYQNPIIFFTIIGSIIFSVKLLKSKAKQSKSITLLFCLSFPMILLFWGLSLFNDILPHWSGPAYISLIILCGFYFVTSAKKWLKKIPLFAGSLVLILFIITTLLANFYGSNFGKKDNLTYGEGCPTLDISGWKQMSIDFAKFIKEDSARKMNNPTLVINNWFPASQFELYTSKHCGLPVVAIGNLENVHQFAWLNNKRKAIEMNSDAYCIVPSNQYFDAVNYYKSYFEKVELIKTLYQTRGNYVVRKFYVYRLINCLRKPNKILP